MNLYLRKAIQDLRRRRVRTMLVILALALGVAGVIAIIGTTRTVPQTLLAAYREGLPEHVGLFAADPQRSAPATILKVNNVLNVEPGFVFRSLTQDGSEERALVLVGRERFTDALVRRLRLVAGRLPGDGEALLDASATKMVAVGLGDDLPVWTPKGMQDLRVVGLAIDPTQPSATVRGQATVWVTMRTFYELTNLPGYNILYVRLAEPGRAEATRDAIVAAFQAQGMLALDTWTNPEEAPFYQNIIGGFFALLGGLSGLALLMSGLLIINTLMTVLAEERFQIGLMKALGATSRRIRAIYFLESLLYGLLGVGLGMLLGVAGTYVLNRYIGSLANVPAISFRPELLSLLFGLGIGLLLPLVAALLPVWSASRVMVQEALVARGLGSGYHRGDRLDRLVVGVTARLGLPRPWALAWRNAFRRRIMLFLTVLTLTIATAAFTAVGATSASLTESVEKVFDLFDADIDISLLTPGDQDVLLSTVKQIPNVAAAEGWLNSDGQLWLGMERIDAVLTGMPVDTDVYRKPVVAGRWFEPEDNGVIALPEELARRYHVLIGDRVQVRVGSVETWWQVVAILRDANLDGKQPKVPYAQLARMIGAEGQADELMIRAHSRTPAQVGILQRELRRTLATHGWNVTPWLIAEERQRNVDQLQIIVTFLNAIVALIAIVGGLGLLTTLTVAVLERRREIGVLRAIGAGRWQVASLLWLEALLIGGIAWVACLPVAYLVGRWLVALLGDALLGIPLEFTFPPLLAGEALLGLVALITLATLGPALTAARLRVASNLRYE